MEYSSRLPKEIRSIIGETHGDIEVSEIHSRKFFNIWNKFVEKANLKLPRVSSPVAKISPLSNAIFDDRSKSIFSPKFHSRNFTKKILILMIQIWMIKIIMSSTSLNENKMASHHVY